MMWYAKGYYYEAKRLGLLEADSESEARRLLEQRQWVPLQLVPAIKDRVLAVQGDYLLEPLVHGHRHSVRFVAP